jgi:hypothetical protein
MSSFLSYYCVVPAFACTSASLEWVELNATTPPYPLETFDEQFSDTDVNLGQRAFLERMSGRSNDSCVASKSYNFALSCPFERAEPIRTGEHFCQLLGPDEHVLLHGDSLANQFASSWQARLLHAKMISKSGAGSACAHLQLDQVRMLPGSGGGPVLSLYGQKHPQFLEFLQLAGLEGCSSTHGAKDFHLLEMHASDYIHRIRRLNASSIIVNTFAHFYRVMRDLSSKCELSMTNATTLVLQYWRSQLLLHAEALAALAGRVRVFYMTSPAPASLFYHKGQPPIVRPLTISEYTSGLRALMGYKFPSSSVSGLPDYGHELFKAVNEMSVEAFRAKGHGVIDLSEALGRRVDAHPSMASNLSSGDFLHFCMPGVPDVVLDRVLTDIVHY